MRAVRSKTEFLKRKGKKAARERRMLDLWGQPMRQTEDRTICQLICPFLRAWGQNYLSQKHQNRTYWHGSGLYCS